MYVHVAPFKPLSPSFQQEVEIKINAAYDLCVQQYKFYMTFTSQWNQKMGNSKTKTLRVSLLASQKKNHYCRTRKKKEKLIKK